MRYLIITFAFGFLISFSANVSAQVIQIPNVATTGAGSTIMVPDGGSAHLASISRLAEGQTSRGVPGLSNVPGLNRLFRNQASGRSASKSTFRVHVQIIDLDAMDKAVLADAAKMRLESAESIRRRRSEGYLIPKQTDSKTKRKAAFINQNIGRRKQQ